MLIAGVLVYSGLVILLMFLRGIEMTPDVMAVAFGLGAVLLGRGIGGMAFAYISFYAVVHARAAQDWLARRRVRLSV